MKRKKPKLQLNKETIARLNNIQLRGILGGEDDPQITMGDGNNLNNCTEKPTKEIWKCKPPVPPDLHTKVGECPK